MPWKSTPLYVWPLADSVALRDVYRFVRESGFSRGFCCRIRSDSYIGRYALVSYLKKEDAVLALNKSGSSLHGMQLEMMIDCHPHTKMSGLVPDTLFVKNLPYSEDSDGLYYLFGKYGRIRYCDTRRCPSVRSSCYGFVQFESDEVCRTAIRGTDGCEWLGMTLRVDHFYLDQEKKIDPDNAELHDGYSQDVADMVRAIGEVIDQHVDAVASKGKSSQQIAKVDAAGAFTDCATDALLDMGNFSSEEHASHIADRLSSLPLTS